MPVATTDEQIFEAVKQSKANSSDLVTALEVKYVPSVEALVLNLSNGLRLFVPREQIQGLWDAPQKNVARVELVGGGSGLHWPELDVDLSADGLIHGVYATEEWMANLGRLGDSARSTAETETKSIRIIPESTDKQLDVGSGSSWGSNPQSLTGINSEPTTRVFGRNETIVKIPETRQQKESISRARTMLCVVSRILPTRYGLM